MKPKESVVSLSLEEICMDLSQYDSYRTAARIANRLLHRELEHEIKHTTLKYRIIAKGSSLASAYESKTANILKQHGINPTSGIITENAQVDSSVTAPSLPESYSMEVPEGIIADYNAGKKDCEKIANPELVSKVERSSKNCCYISIDDIGVKHQKECRRKSEKKDAKYVENTLIHILSDKGKYTITTIGMRKAFIMLTAFLLSNGLMENTRLIFLSDGATCIKDYIEEFFGFREYTLILDWLHLKKKCKEYLSMAVKGKDKEERKEITKGLLHILWAGNTDNAIAFLSDLEQRNIKNPARLEQLKDYLGRKKPYIHCYALRAASGLRTSSNTVEKDNDINVAQRQKHNGMSWSKAGSGALAVITVARHNNELCNWIRTGNITFRLVA